MTPLVVVDTHVKSIVLYGSDRDLCNSLQLLFQDDYRIFTAEDFNAVAPVVDDIAPALLIADVLPTERVGGLFAQLKQRHPELNIVLFFAPRYHGTPLPESIRKNVDSILYKPVDLETVTTRVRESISHAH